MRVRRTKHVFFYCYDGRLPDIAALLSGTVCVTPMRQIFAISALTGKEQPITRVEFDALLDVPTDDWVAREELLERGTLTDDRVDFLTRQGVLLCDHAAEPFRTHRSRDAAVSSSWNAVAALYRAVQRWRGVRLAGPDDERHTMTFADLHSDSGRPPPHFRSVKGLDSCRLPRPEREGHLYATLLSRRTIRTFDSTAFLEVEDLAVILDYVFGCHGYLDLDDDLWLLRKTSPSGGGLHPIEVYPLLHRVQGFKPGLYHYNVECHELTALRLMTEEEVAETALVFAAGQAYARNVQALFVMTARFPRSFWKYRRHEKAYSVVMMDAGHLSQTFYLVCTELGLGPFVTAAINDRNIEDMLGIDGFEEGAIAVLGVGYPAAGHDGIDPVFKPYAPHRRSS